MKNWNGFDKLELEVTRINEGIELTQTLLVDTYLIEAEIDKYDNMIDFKGFTGEVTVSGFKHIGSTTRITPCNANVTWDGDKIEIVVHNVENIRITLPFNAVCEFEEEFEGEIELSTSFDY
ncbi:MAG: hypothetical protein ACRDD7_04715 [Peptostreptococcaceae bacterium]